MARRRGVACIVYETRQDYGGYNIEGRRSYERQPRTASNRDDDDNDRDDDDDDHDDEDDHGEFDIDIADDAISSRTARSLCPHLDGLDVDVVGVDQLEEHADSRLLRAAREPPGTWLGPTSIQELLPVQVASVWPIRPKIIPYLVT